jgi:uncharacterized membrane protein (DUF373 family)
MFAIVAYNTNILVATFCKLSNKLLRIELIVDFTLFTSLFNPSNIDEKTFILLVYCEIFVLNDELNEEDLQFAEVVDASPDAIPAI